MYKPTENERLTQNTLQESRRGRRRFGIALKFTQFEQMGRVTFVRWKQSENLGVGGGTPSPTANYGAHIHTFTQQQQIQQ